ncbi:MAG: hypothetical protein K9G49_12655 [Taibaiella sp.]|nr:hypothetical protein [Taibaiella sp.]
MKCFVVTLICVAAFFCSPSAAQDTKKLPITFVLTYGLQPLNIAYENEPLNKDSTLIQACRFYISAIEFYEDDRLQWKESNSYHLLDAATAATLQLLLNVPEKIHYSSIKFRLGIDSTTNVSGAMGGDLDPSKGMYWSWQSGYINFKLEGRNTKCPGRNNEFHFHLGGYASSFASMQTVALTTENTNSIAIQFDVQQFLSGIDLTTQNNIMIPGNDAVILSKKAASIFTTKK